MTSKPSLRFASFAIPVPLYRVFDYALDADDKALPGTRYRLPFGRTGKTGILIATHKTTDIAIERIKATLECLDDAPVLSTHMLKLARWMADYYLQPPGDVLFQCIPAYLRSARREKPKRIKYWFALAGNTEQCEVVKKRSPRQWEMMLALQQAPQGLNALQLKAINPAWSGVIRALESRQLIEWRYLDSQTDSSLLEALPQLSADQARVVAELEQGLGGFAVHLLDGVTGSGKTEVYFRIIQSRLSVGYQVIYLVPEIGLTSQLVERVKKRFGEQFTVSHSGLTDRQRYLAWEQFRQGEVNIMLGTRSSLFSQSDRLGLIIIDEEHDSSYKQEDGIRYHARDVAIKRAQMLDVPILLGSATPSLESLNNCQREHYFLHRLTQRPTGYEPPHPGLIDIQHVKLQTGCSPQLLDKIGQHLKRNGQVLLYLNRRGFAPVVMCHECGWQADCVHCDSKLTLHQSINRLLCHHCGYGHMMPNTCPNCKQEDIKHYGIGTQQLEQGLQKRFPQFPIIRIDRDSISSRDEFTNRLEQIREGNPCILIGTQMIAKGHDYPAITLSAILDADQALFSASYRASERLAQVVYQVSGRSGRGERRGEAVIQTRFVQHPLMMSLVSQDYRQIAAQILQERNLLGFPPFARVVVFRADAVSIEQAMDKLLQIKQRLNTNAKIRQMSCIGPMPALMTRRVGRFRAQLCLLCRDITKLRAGLREVMPEIEAIDSNHAVKWVVDVDAADL